MIPDLKIPVLLQEVHRIDNSVAEIQDRIEKRAYDKFLQRGLYNAWAGLWPFYMFVGERSAFRQMEVAQGHASHSPFRGETVPVNPGSLPGILRVRGGELPELSGAQELAAVWYRCRMSSPATMKTTLSAMLVA